MSAAPLPKSSDLMNVLADIEAQFPVLNWRASGVAIWPCARVRWFMAEWSRLYLPPAASGAGGARRLANLFVAPMRALFAERRSGVTRDADKTDVVFLSDGISLTRLAGNWVDRFCDPLIARVREGGLQTALWMPSHDTRWYHGVRARLVQPAIDRANLRGVIRARARRGQDQWERSAELAEWMRARDLAPDALAPQRLAIAGARIRALADTFVARLRRAQPRLAFLVNYYSLEGMAFVMACRELGIPTVDIQHGVQGEHHPAYAAWPSQTSPHALLPDYFWVWSGWERDVIERWSGGCAHRAVVGGNPWLEVWSDERRWPGVAESRRAVDELCARAAGKPVVLVTLQYGFQPSEQIEPLERLVRASAGRFVFWIRLHPMMIARLAEIRARFGADPHCEIDAPTELPLQALLARAGAHLTHSSSTVIEAAQFGVHSVITTLFGEELFEPLYQAGYAQTAAGELGEVCAALERALSAREAGGERPDSAVGSFQDLWRQIA